MIYQYATAEADRRRGPTTRNGGGLERVGSSPDTDSRAEQIRGRILVSGEGQAEGGALVEEEAAGPGGGDEPVGAQYGQVLADAADG